MSNTNDQTESLPAEIYEFEKKLESARLAAVGKTKGLFKRAFLRSWLVLSVGLIGLGLLISENEGFEIVQVIGPVMISLFLGLIGGGIYTLVRKGSSNMKLPQITKNSLIPKIVAFVNPDLTFSEKGITRKEFNEADLFEGPFFYGEDSIEGTQEGAKVHFSECMSKSKLMVYFNGPFVQIDMKEINVSTPLKFFPSFIAEDMREKIRNYKGVKKWRPMPTIKNAEEDRVLLKDKGQDPRYEIYCKSKSEAEALLKPSLLKFIGDIYDKYDEKSIFISLNKNKCYLALGYDQHRNMFDTSTWLQNDLVKTKFADQMHSDAILANQLMTDIGKINKI